jgi:hypothetical protein
MRWLNMRERDEELSRLFSVMQKLRDLPLLREQAAVRCCETAWLPSSAAAGCSSGS